MSWRRLLITLAVTVVAAAVVLPLSAWLSETVSIDCRRDASPPRCMIELSYRNHTELHAVDVAALVSATAFNRIQPDRDGGYDESWHLRVELRADGPSGKAGRIESAAGDRDAHRERARQINAFIATPSQPRLMIHFNDRSYRAALAWLLIATIAFGAYVLTRE